MYESDEWYIQDDLTAKQYKKKGRAFTNMVDYTQSATHEVDEEWDLDASASDNESFDLEMEQM
ncbi:hypothetical protein [Ammoniphilus sp. CFH 90114]|uniref:hypothetical protein n=1 Tax=Ammoniphilus sp. CFH 90114 TaxID=2493665 RepID=UPI00100E9003|nr:hypothetical protein [Ammoniphilus sp. CFH 90114]RXT15309.1 hypothetical protein EIZ39_03635 [Ammoniphilus sp. CFH 90114]